MKTLVSPVAAGLLLTVVVSAAAVTPEKQGPKEVITIRTNTQAQFGDLRIAAGNFWDDEYTDARNVSRKRPGAALFVSLRQGEIDAKDFTARVHIGKELTAGKYLLRVTDIRIHERNSRVTVEVSEPRKE